MRLLLIVPEVEDAELGGIATFYGGLLTGLVRMGCRIHVVVTFPRGRFPANLAPGVTVEAIEAGRVEEYRRSFDHLRAVPVVRDHLSRAWAAWEQSRRGEGFDLVETADWGLLFAPWIASDDAPPVVVQLHGSSGQIAEHDPFEGRDLEGDLLRVLEAGLLSSADALQTYSETNSGAWMRMTGRSVATIPPAWSPPETARQEHTLSDRGLVVGRVQAWKGPDVLCRAVRSLGEKAPPIDWVGRDMPYRRLDRSMSAHLAETFPDVWGRRVRPVGPLARPDTARRQAAAAFVVVPSVWDTFNFTCAEAMGLGKVVLCSEGAGAHELVEDGVTGLRFPPGDPQALREALQRWLGLDESSRREIGERARESVRRALDPESVIERRVQAYEAVAKEGKWPVRPSRWLVSAAGPRRALGRPYGFLDQYPLRELVAHAVRRAMRKVVN
jgi:glycosyltransferase involved in cell wall biosynthesis